MILSAQKFLNQSLTDSIERTLKEQNHFSDCKIIADSDAADYPNEKISILTLSSYDFRCLVLLYFSRNHSLEHHIIKTLDTTTINDTVIHDYINEIGNNICGHIKRNLLTISDSVGMSTPHILEGHSSHYFEDQKIAEISSAHTLVLLDDQALFGTSLFFYADKSVDMSNLNIKTEEVIPESGALEFF